MRSDEDRLRELAKWREVEESQPGFQSNENKTESKAESNEDSPPPYGEEGSYERRAYNTWKEEQKNIEAKRTQDAAREQAIVIVQDWIKNFNNDPNSLFAINREEYLKIKESLDKADIEKLSPTPEFSEWLTFLFFDNQRFIAKKMEDLVFLQKLVDQQKRTGFSSIFTLELKFELDVEKNRELLTSIIKEPSTLLLDLGATKLTDSSVNILGGIIKELRDSKENVLKNLQLRSSFKDTEITAERLEALLNILPESNELNLNGLKFKPEEKSKIIGIIISKIPQLKSINLDNCGFTEKDFGLLLPHLRISQVTKISIYPLTGGSNPRRKYVEDSIRAVIKDAFPFRRFCELVDEYSVGSRPKDLDLLYIFPRNLISSDVEYAHVAKVLLDYFKLINSELDSGNREINEFDSFLDYLLKFNTVIDEAKADSALHSQLALQRDEIIIKIGLLRAKNLETIVSEENVESRAKKLIMELDKSYQLNYSLKNVLRSKIASVDEKTATDVYSGLFGLYKRMILIEIGRMANYHRFENFLKENTDVAVLFRQIEKSRNVNDMQKAWNTFYNSKKLGIYKNRIGVAVTSSQKNAKEAQGLINNLINEFSEFEISYKAKKDPSQMGAGASAAFFNERRSAINVAVKEEKLSMEEKLPITLNNLNDEEFSEFLGKLKELLTEDNARKWDADSNVRLGFESLKSKIVSFTEKNEAKTKDQLKQELCSKILECWKTVNKSGRINTIENFNNALSEILPRLTQEAFVAGQSAGPGIQANTEAGFGGGARAGAGAGGAGAGTTRGPRPRTPPR